MLSANSKFVMWLSFLYQNLNFAQIRQYISSTRSYFFEDFACVISLLIWGPINLRVQINVRDNLSLLHAWWFNISWLPQSSFTYLVLILRENSLQKGELLCRTALPYSPTRRHLCGWGESSTDMLRLQLYIYILSLFKLCLQSFRRELTYRYFINAKDNVDH